jgi:hypothetical protein
MMHRHREAGRVLRRLRIISEPVTDYIRFEWLDAGEMVKAGEDVRWLPRQQALAPLLPGNDFWCFDDETVMFTHFSGGGKVQGYELTTDTGLVSRVPFPRCTPSALPRDLAYSRPPAATFWFLLNIMGQSDRAVLSSSW